MDGMHLCILNPLACDSFVFGKGQFKKFGSLG